MLANSEVSTNLLSSEHRSDKTFGVSINSIPDERMTDVDTPASKGGSNSIGLFFILILVTCTVVMTECMQSNHYIETHVISFRWLVVSTYSLMFPIAFGIEHCCKQGKEHSTGRGSLFRKTALSSFWTSYFAMWLAGYLWYVSLRGTTVAVNNSVAQLQCVWIYLLSVLVLSELITVRKSLGLIISLVGVVLIAESTSDGKEDKQNTIQGVLCAILSSVLVATYEVIVKFVQKKHHEDEESSSVQDSLYFLGYCGIWCLVTGPIVVFVCHHLGFEHFDLPDMESLYVIVEVCALDLLYNVILVLAITFMSPYTVSMGSLLAVPGAFFADWLVGKMKTPPDWMQITGAVLIVAGFLVLELKIGREKKDVFTRQG